ncbi:unnamed protein product [Lota lota]
MSADGSCVHSSLCRSMGPPSIPADHRAVRLSSLADQDSSELRSNKDPPRSQLKKNSLKWITSTDQTLCVQVEPRLFIQVEPRLSENAVNSGSAADRVSPAGEPHCSSSIGMQGTALSPLDTKAFLGLSDMSHMEQDNRQARDQTRPTPEMN